MNSSGIIYFTSDLKASIGKNLNELNGSLIAPFWAPVKIGTVYYRYHVAR